MKVIFIKVRKENEKIEKKNSSLRDEKSSLEKDIRNLEISVVYKKKILDIEIEEIKGKIVNLQRKAITAEQKKKGFEDEYTRKMQDLNIYSERVKVKYEKVFPRRTIKLK